MANTEDGYIPTTGTVCDVYATANGHPEAPRRREYFWRWYDAEIQAAEARRAAKELREAARNWPFHRGYLLNHRHVEPDVMAWLNDRAAQLEKQSDQLRREANNGHDRA